LPLAPIPAGHLTAELLPTFDFQSKLTCGLGEAAGGGGEDGGDEAEGGEELDGEIAIADGVHRVVSDGGKIEQPGDKLAVENDGGPGDGAGAERHDIHALAGVADAFEVALEHLDVGEQMVGEEDGLGALKMGIARNDQVAVALGEPEQGSPSLLDAVERIGCLDSWPVVDDALALVEHYVAVIDLDVLTAHHAEQISLPAVELEQLQALRFDLTFGRHGGHAAHRALVGRGHGHAQLSGNLWVGQRGGSELGGALVLLDRLNRADCTAVTVSRFDTHTFLMVSARMVMSARHPKGSAVTAPTGAAGW